VPSIPEVAVPHLTIRHSGKIVEPPPRLPTGPTIRINGALRTLEVVRPETAGDSQSGANDDGEFSEDVEALIQAEPQRTDGPDWMCASPTGQGIFRRAFDETFHGR
jgi:hypothetical protein